MSKEHLLIRFIGFTMKYELAYLGMVMMHFNSTAYLRLKLTCIDISRAY
jgi:hypothetical protein